MGVSKTPAMRGEDTSMPIDEERLRQRLRQYDFDEEEIETAGGASRRA
jgi:uncharacterized protein Smg (DUF494 family)